jgi:hypothetical protein
MASSERTRHRVLQWIVPGQECLPGSACDGTVFDLDSRQVVPAVGQIPEVADSSPNSIQFAAEQSIWQACHSGEVTLEQKIEGVPIRFWRKGGKLTAATMRSAEGADPLIGVGVDNPASLGLFRGAHALSLAAASYPRINDLVAIGYTPSFVMCLPEMVSMIPCERPDLILTDVLDPRFDPVDRLELERIAEDYRLRAVPLEGRLVDFNSEDALLKRLRSLGHQASQQMLAGYVVKARTLDGKWAALQVPSVDIRDWKPAFAEGDIATAAEFAASITSMTGTVSASQIAELTLDVIGVHTRSVRRQVEHFFAQDVSEAAI